MKAAIIFYLPWLLSIITIYMTVLAGNKAKHAWLVGMGNQFLWLTWIMLSGTWGLLPMNLALWVVYGRNHLKWRQSGPNPLPYVTLRSTAVAAEDIRVGQVVVRREDGKLELTGKGQRPIGAAIETILKGQLVEWDPLNGQMRVATRKAVDHGQG